MRKETDKLGCLREPVAWFACAMEYKLRMNDHKQPWADMSFVYLMARLREETKELEHAIETYNCHDRETVDDKCARDTVIQEAADVANFAMMIADNMSEGDFRTDG